MPRIRTIKPEFFSHEELFDLEEETGLPIRLAFAGIWTICDREGRFKWRPRTIKAHVLPYDSVEFSRVLHALTTRGFVVKYEVDGVEYGVVPGFSRHQVINNRELASVLPEPPEIQQNIGLARVADACTTRDPRVDHACQGERKGKEGKGREGEGKGTAPVSAEVSKPPEVEQQSWDDWKAARKTKRAGPITQTVLTMIEREAESAGISLQEAVAMAAGSSWITFKAEYVNGKSAQKTFRQLQEENTQRAIREFVGND